MKDDLGKEGKTDKRKNVWITMIIGEKVEEIWDDGSG